MFQLFKVLKLSFALESPGIDSKNPATTSVTPSVSGYVYWRKHDSAEIVSMNNGPELGDEQIQVFEAISLVLEAHRSAWVAFPFIRMLKTDLTCNLSFPSPIFPLNTSQCPPMVIVRPHYNTEDQYLESLEEFNRMAGLITYGNQIPSTSAIENGNHN